MFLKFVNPTRTSIFEVESFTTQPVNVDSEGNRLSDRFSQSGAVPGLSVHWGRGSELVLANHPHHWTACFVMNGAGATIDTLRAPEVERPGTPDSTGFSSFKVG